MPGRRVLAWMVIAGLAIGIIIYAIVCYQYAGMGPPRRARPLPPELLAAHPSIPGGGS